MVAAGAVKVDGVGASLSGVGARVVTVPVDGRAMACVGGEPAVGGSGTSNNAADGDPIDGGGGVAGGVKKRKSRDLANAVRTSPGKVTGCEKPMAGASVAGHARPAIVQGSPTPVAFPSSPIGHVPRPWLPAYFKEVPRGGKHDDGTGARGGPSARGAAKAIPE